MAAGGSVAVAADVGDSAGMCWRRKEGRGWKGSEWDGWLIVEREGGEEEEEEEGTGSTWPGAYVHAGIAWPLRRLGSSYLPTLNLCQPTITGYPSFHPCSVRPARSTRCASMPNSRGSRDARWICIKCSFVEHGLAKRTEQSDDLSGLLFARRKSTHATARFSEKNEMRGGGGKVCRSE